MKTWPNKFSGTCEACGVHVAAKKGHAYRSPKGWRVCCASSVCGDKLGLAGAATKGAVVESRELTADGRVIMPYEAAAIPLLRSFPGAKFDRDASPKCWRVSLDPGDRDRVLELAEKLQLKIAPELQTVSEDIEALSAKLVEQGLYPFQVKGVCWMRQRRRVLLGDDMGLGKTVQVLAALPESARAIVICPASLKYNWRDECERWRPDLTPSVLAGRGSFRLPEEGEVVITNYDILPPAPFGVALVGKKKYELHVHAKLGLRWKLKGKDDQKHDIGGKDLESALGALVKFLGCEGDAVRYTEGSASMSLKGVVLVADEATAVKNYKAQRSQSVKALAKTSDKVWFLSGTPMLNRPFDLFGLLESGGMAYDVFGGWRTFLRCFQGYKNKWGGYEFGEPLAETPERLRRVMIRRTKEEVLPDLPKCTYKTITVNGSDKKLKKELDTAWQDWLEEAAALGDLDDDGNPETLPPFEQFSELRAKLAASRIPAMLEIVEQYEDAELPLIVFSAHRAPIDTLADREGWEVITGDTNNEKRNKIVKRFQAGELKGVGLTIKAGGYGITLTHASHELFVDLDWTPAANAQAEDRARRIGQTADKIQVTRMVSDHALDKHVHGLLSQKIHMIYKAIEASVEYKAPKAKAAPKSNWVEESEADQQARKDALVQAAKDAETAAAKSKIYQIILQEQAHEKAKPGEALKLTLPVREALTAALSYMKSVCDGAHSKDGMGFNKPDAYRTDFLAPWMATGEESAFRAAAMILCRYRKQLAKKFPVLFPKKLTDPLTSEEKTEMVDFLSGFDKKAS